MIIITYQASVSRGQYQVIDAKESLFPHVLTYNYSANLISGIICRFCTLLKSYFYFHVHQNTLCGANRGDNVVPEHLHVERVSGENLLVTAIPAHTVYFEDFRSHFMERLKSRKLDGRKKWVK